MSYLTDSFANGSTPTPMCDDAEMLTHSSVIEGFTKTDYTTVYDLMAALIDKNAQITKDLQEKAYICFDGAAEYRLAKYQITFDQLSQKCTPVSWSSNEWNSIEITTQRVVVNSGPGVYSSPPIKYDLQMVKILDEQTKMRTGNAYPAPAVTLNSSLIAYPNPLSTTQDMAFAQPTRSGVQFRQTLMNPYNRIETLIKQLNTSPMFKQGSIEGNLQFAQQMLDELLSGCITKANPIYAVAKDQLMLFTSLRAMYDTYPLLEYFSSATGVKNSLISYMINGDKHPHIFVFKGSNDLLNVFAVSKEQLKQML